VLFRKVQPARNFFCEKTLLFGLFNLQTSQFGRSIPENLLSQKSGKLYLAHAYDIISKKKFIADLLKFPNKHLKLLGILILSLRTIPHLS
jgi:hypothetical protein